MRLTDSIQSRAVCAALIANSCVTLVAVGIATWALTREPPGEREVAPIARTESCLESPSPQWASSVRGFSSEYSQTSWSARQVIGPPNVFPSYGDQPGAWASLEPDAQSEYIEVSFAQPQRTRALEIYETYNPGAITRVELITEQGTRIALSRRELRPNGGAAVSSFGAACTREAIIAARIFVDSGNVPGWNEVDAVALLPCQ